MLSLGPTDHEPSALLSDDTLSALELREQPFLRPETTAEAFSDEVTTDQLADIRQALITGDDLLLILGEPGIGKSTLLAQLGDDSGLRIQCFSVEGSARFSAVNLFGGMLEAFKREPPDNLKTMLDELIPCLQGMISNNTLSTVVIDNADAVDAIEMTRLLSAMLYMNSQDETLMRIALSAPAAFEERIPELLPEGADLPYSTLTIEPFEHERAANYLSWRFERAGEAPGIPFDEAQIVDMNGRAEGNPRRLHEIVADELNSLHGELEPAIPPELLAGSSSDGSFLGASLFSGRSPKILLGGLGALLIVLGLLLFLPDGEEQDDRYTKVEQRKLDDQQADRLALVDEEAPTIESSSPESGTPELTSTESPVTDGTIASAAEDATHVATDKVLQESSDANQETTTVIEEVSEDIDFVEELPTNDVDATDVALEAEGGASTESSLGNPSENEAPEPTESDELADALDVPETGNQATQPATIDSTPAPVSTGPSPVSDPSVPSAPSAPSAPSTPSINDRMESPNWILTQNSDLFTIQMIASTSRSEVEVFLTDANLKGPNSIFTFQRAGVDWYALVHGLYDSIEDARSAIIRMPDAALSFQPWIRSVGRVQNSLRK